MVGVAGKSQACHDCRQRRMKCDLSRPSCRKCIKAKRQCSGYNRDLIFVNRTPSNPSTTAASVLYRPSAQPPPKGDMLAHPGRVAELQHLFTQAPDHSREFRKFSFELLEAIYLPKLPSPSSLNANISEGSFTWVYRLTDLHEPSRSLDTSLFALSLAQLHIWGSGDVSLYQCLDQYSAALQHLHSDLNHPVTRFQEETLAAIVVLSTCELFVSDADMGFSVHANGIAEILQLRDPEMASTPAWRHLISRMRVLCTLEALTKRQAQPLKIDMLRPILSESNLSGDLDDVFHMLSSIPAMLERAVALSPVRDPMVLMAESGAVSRELLGMAKTIGFWLRQFLKASPTPRFWSTRSSAVNPADVDPLNKVFSTCFEFESIAVAVPIVMCCGVAAQIYSTVIQIHDLVQARLGRQIELDYHSTHPDVTTVSTANTIETSIEETLLFAEDMSFSIQRIQDDGARMARYVCQSMEYFHRIEMGTFGNHAALYPTWSARQYFRLHPGYKQELSWLQNMTKMTGPGMRWSIATMPFADFEEPLGGWPS